MITAPRRARLLAAATAFLALGALTLGTAGTAQAAPASTASRAAVSPLAAPRAAAPAAAAPRAATTRAALPSSAVPRTTTTSSVPVSSLPAGGIAPAELNPNTALLGMGNVVEYNGDLYGTGAISTSGIAVLQKWNGYRFTRVAGSPSQDSYQPVVFNDEIYFLAYNPQVDTDILWSFDGTRFRTHAQLSSTAYLVAGDTCLDIFEYTGTREQVACLTADESYSGIASTTTSVTGAFSWNGTLYAFLRSSTKAGLYRVDESGFTRLLTSPIAFEATEWNGDVYFGGATYSATTKTYTNGMYRFDGTLIEPVDVGAVIPSTSYDTPTTGVVGDDLFFTTDSKEKATTLFRFDGTSTTRLGSIGAGYSYEIVGHDGLVFANMDAEDGVHTFLYDPAATTGATVHSSVPAVSGTAKVGSVVTAALGDWTATADLSFQWFHGGAPISGATKRYHTVTAADLGKTLTIEVSGEATGFVSTVQNSAATAAVAPGTAAVAVVIAGTMTAGHTLTASTSHLTPTTAALSYRWYRDGKPLAGATKRTYTITSGDRGHKLTVAVHATKTGYTTGAKLSAARTVAK